MKLTADTLIRGSMEQVRRLSQMPEDHVRWDARFTRIEYLPNPTADAPKQFRYQTRIGPEFTVTGWGETEADGRGGTVLRFGSTDWKSLIREGCGCWIYSSETGGVRFRTVYDYSTRWGWFGKWIDRLAFRPLLIWATRWSFDRLRLWIERGLAPEIAFRLWGIKCLARLSLGWVWILEGLCPKLLDVRASEIELVRRSGLFWSSPDITLAALGVCEIAAGVILAAGWAERTGALVSGLAICVFTALAIGLEPVSLFDPFGGIVKNLGLLFCAAAVWFLEPLAPKARRSRGANGPSLENTSPFEAALGGAANRLAPKVRNHFAMPGRCRRFYGVMSRIWRREDGIGRLAIPFLWLGARMETLFSETGKNIPFVLENGLQSDSSGRMTMTWNRTFYFPGRTRCFSAVMHFDERRRVLVDRLGAFRHLEVELHAVVEQGALRIRSGRQWLRLGRLRLRLPRWFTGAANVREWQQADGSFGIWLTVRNPLLGEFFGYEGAFQEASPCD